MQGKKAGREEAGSGPAVRPTEPAAPPRRTAPKPRVSVWLAVWLGACAPRGPEPVPDDALVVVDALETALVRGDKAEARRQVDFRFRLEEALGDLWRSGPESARQELVRRMEQMFDETADGQQARWAGRRMEREQLRRDRNHLWVESRPADGEDFAWQYRLTRKGDSWAITQREYRVHGARSASTRFFPMARAQIAKQMGHPPSLEELAANLPSVMGTMRARSFKVPPPPGRPKAPTTP